MEHEFRYLPFDRAEVRVEEDGGKLTLSGYAAVFNSLSEDLGGFRERILPGAFRQAIDEGQDVVLVPDHSYAAAGILGRSKNGTLKLSENDIGLKVRCVLPDTTTARDIAAVVKRGDVRGMSFAFGLPDASAERWLEEGGIIVREITRTKLYDVSVVTWPAYQASSVKVDKRCLQCAESLRAAPMEVLRLERERLLFL